MPSKPQHDMGLTNVVNATMETIHWDPIRQSNSNKEGLEATDPMLHSFHQQQPSLDP
jgi:hypothetical protein